MKLDLRKKVVLIGAIQLAIVVAVLFAFYYYEAKENVTKQYVEKARGIILTAESTREEMGKKWDLGVFNSEQLGKWAEAGEMDKVLAAVPVATAWKAAMAKANEGAYKFRVPKFGARNPENTPDPIEARVLKKLERGDIDEHYEIDESLNAIRYFRPIKLTQECMLCHGDPATSKEIWGNDDGVDPTGVRMENWKVGEVHGAFEVVQSLDQADAEIAASLTDAGLLVLGLLVGGSSLFYFVVTRSVVNPIKRIVQGMNEGSDQVNDAAAQVAGASQQLAESAVTQASSLEETSSALEQMAAMTRTNAETAQQASELSDQARLAAQGGDETMNQLNNAMTAINSSSSEISKIIKVIEEIAFQTNLLALNAAVEAARAGEHGKGFAVVADEVRNLAQRAAEAARETTGLIDDSVNKTKEGSGVAGEVGQALGEIVGDVAKVAELINGISKASQEQSQGVDQVNTAVSQMDKVTQQNASGAEESAAAAEQLSAQSSALKSMVEELALVVTGHTSTGSPVGSSYRRAAASPPSGNKGKPSAQPVAVNSGDDFMALDDGGDLEDF